MSHENGGRSTGKAARNGKARRQAPSADDRAGALVPAGARHASDLTGFLLVLVRELTRRDHEAGQLLRLRARLQDCTDLEQALEVVAGSIGELFGRRGGCLALLREPDTRLKVVTHWGDTQVFAASFDRAECLALSGDLSSRIATTTAASRCQHVGGAAAVGTLCVPLTSGRDGWLGLLCLSGLPAGAAPAPDDQRTALAVRELTEVSLRSVRRLELLREQVVVDALTGLYNRRHLDEILVRLLHRWRRRAFPLCLALLDVDHFKRQNDRHGHAAGDALLHELGALLVDSIRKGDIACRYGGDEFAIVFADAEVADARRRVEQICDRFKDRMAERELGVVVSLSAGLAQVGGTIDDPAALLGAADQALYRAKQAGRDRVVVAGGA